MQELLHTAGHTLQRIVQDDNIVHKLVFRGLLPHFLTKLPVSQISMDFNPTKKKIYLIWM